MWQWQKHLAPAVCLGIGASLDFVVGVQKRSPTWMSKLGLEWVYRLANDPRRMAQRYLVRDRAIVGIAARMLRAPHSARAYEV
jgi:N-acetylglucosaminyldiphosphoundecaprenol N-acetyl-beta-D-mannosaminyltransferase